MSANIPLFIAFRVLFNARWYYPVLAILFLDFGLSLEQYALLNVAWAVAIVCLEVPSGALADQLGRKRMVVIAAALMVVEMAIFAFVPRGAAWLFPLFLLNRVLSGAAEASASGADEALAYDSLVADGRGEEWPRVLERLGRWQSAGFFIAMMIGAAVYDPALVQRVADAAGVPFHATQEITLRFPLYLTLLNAVLALGVALRMREPEAAGAAAAMPVTAWSATRSAGKWILHTPAALVIILAGLCFDSIIRMFLTLGSTYYRLIELPEATFGLIGSGFAVLGFFTPTLARRLVARCGMRTNFGIVAATTLIGLLGLALAWPIYGLVFAIPIGIAMSLTQFFTSHYLNAAVTDSRRRATVLSFKGLSFNLAYGAAGLLFAALTRALQGPGKDTLAVFAESLWWLPGYFAGTVALLALAAARLHGSEAAKSPPDTPPR